MQDTTPKLQPLKTVHSLLLGVLLCAVIGLACFLGGRSSVRNNESAPLDAVVLENRLMEISELATVSYHYTNMAQFENSSDFYGVKIPFTTKRFLLSYDGEIKAGIDLKQSRVSLKDGDVTVSLPEAAILSHEIDAGSMEIFDEKSSLFNPFVVADFTSFQTGQKSLMEKKAIENGLLLEAAEKSRETVLFLLTPLLPEDCHISVNLLSDT